MPQLAVLSIVTFILAGSYQPNAEKSPSAPSQHLPNYLKVCGDQKHLPCATAPALIQSPSPDYTESARQGKIEGIVVLEFIVGVDGHPHNIHVVTYLGHGLDEQAIEALKKWVFEPGISEGVPVPVLVKTQMAFRLRP